MKAKNKALKAKRNYWIDIISFTPFLLLLVSGIFMLLYHGGKPTSETTIGLSGNEWRVIHKTLTIIAVPLVLLHLYLHLDWVKKLFTLRLTNKFKGINISLFIAFILCLITSLFSWFVFGDTEAGKALKGIHNKLGLLLIVFFVIHALNYSKWIIGMTKQVLKRKIDK